MNWSNLLNSNLRNCEIRKLMKNYRTLDEVYKNFDILDNDIKRKLEKNIKPYILEDNKVRIISYHDEEYPEYLKSIKDFPTYIFAKGKKIKLDRSIAIVGTRNCTNIGLKSCEKIIKGLSEYENISVISGLARGIDEYAHRYALKYGLNTIAVIPTDIYSCYPLENIKLKEEIENNATVISEFKKGTKLAKSNFVLRNRIVVALSRAVCVIQSAKSSGSLISAKYANIYDRELYAIPSNIFDDTFEGNNELIKTNKAKLITCADDIAYEYAWRKKSEEIFSNSRIAF